MSTITIRTNDDHLSQMLRRESKARGESINKLVIAAIEYTYEKKTTLRHCNDLDYLAGTWDEADLEDFQQATADFDRIDPQDWL